MTNTRYPRYTAILDDDGERTGYFKSLDDNGIYTIDECRTCKAEADQYCRNHSVLDCPRSARRSESAMAHRSSDSDKSETAGRIPVSAAREIATRYKLKQCLLIGWDGEMAHVVTFGKTKADCEAAAKAQDFWTGKIREFSFKGDVGP